MTTPDPILNALAQMEQRLRDEVRDSYRELKLEMIGSFDAIHHRLDRLEQEYEMLKAGIARLEADVGILKQAVAGLESDVGALKEGVARLEAEMTLVKEAIERLEARIDREPSDREDLRGQALEFRRRLDALEGRVHELEGRLPPE